MVSPSPRDARGSCLYSCAQRAPTNNHNEHVPYALPSLALCPHSLLPYQQACTMLNPETKVQRVARDLRALRRRHRELGSILMSPQTRPLWEAFLQDWNRFIAEQKQASQRYETWKQMVVESDRDLNAELARCPAPGHDHPEYHWSL